MENLYGVLKRVVVNSTIEFLRSKLDTRPCICCPDGHHIFNRSLMNYDAVAATNELLSHNEFEGKRVRITYEVLADGYRDAPTMFDPTDITGSTTIYAALTDPLARILVLNSVDGRFDADVEGIQRGEEVRQLREELRIEQESHAATNRSYHDMQREVVELNQANATLQASCAYYESELNTFASARDDNKPVWEKPELALKGKIVVLGTLVRVAGDGAEVTLLSDVLRTLSDGEYVLYMEVGAV